MKKTQTIIVKDTTVTIVEKNEQDFISLTDMAKNFGGSSVIENWLRNKDTIDFLGIWEQLYNPDFNSLEFEGIKNQAGYNRLHFLQKIGCKTNAIGLLPNRSIRRTLAKRTSLIGPGLVRIYSIGKGFQGLKLGKPTKSSKWCIWAKDLFSNINFSDSFQRRRGLGKFFSPLFKALYNLLSNAGVFMRSPFGKTPRRGGTHPFGRHNFPAGHFL